MIFRPCSLLYQIFKKRKPENVYDSALHLKLRKNNSDFHEWIKNIPYLICLIALFFVISCSKTEQPRIVPSVIPEESPRLLGVNHLYSIKGYFSSPAGIAVEPDKTIYVADAGMDIIYILDGEGNMIDSTGRFGWRTGEFIKPMDLALDNRLTLYIADTGNDRIQKMNLVSKTFKVILGKDDVKLTESINLSAPESVAVDSSGSIYLTDTLNNRILKVDTLGRLQMEIKGSGGNKHQLVNPQGIAVDRMGNIYLANTDKHQIHKLDFSGTLLDIWGQEGTSESQFQYPTDLALDKFGNLYVLDQGNRRIQVFDSQGTFLIQFGKVILTKPIGVAVDNGLRVYVTDSESASIEIFRIIYQQPDSK
ncbi:hypothetical protein GF312_17870 [Candidatus Poribacteria bacterium]|nr:hypothetical protein [Candidatus Poribacteria bacterium]